MLASAFSTPCHTLVFGWLPHASSCVICLCENCDLMRLTLAKMTKIQKKGSFNIGQKQRNCFMHISGIKEWKYDVDLITKRRH